MFKRSRNTLDKGRIRYIIFKEESTWYGVALDLNIVVDAESKIESSIKLDAAVNAYLNTARFAKMRDNILNQETSKEYTKLWKDLEAGREPRINKVSEDGGSEEKATIKWASYEFLGQVA